MNNSPIPAPDMLIDSHVHLDFRQFDSDREEVLARARAKGVFGFVVPGVKSCDWVRIQSLASGSGDVFPCYGLHPCFVAEHQPQDLDQLRLWLEREPAVAVGECGLDFYQHFAESESKQRLYFESQLAMAKEFDLPVVLHARRSVDAVLKCLRQADVHRGVMHSFSGSLQQAKAAIDQGMMIGVGGAVTHERAKKLQSVVAVLPLHALVLETDAPDQPGSLHQGQRNESVYINEVLDVVASIRSESRALIAAATSKNSARLFALSI